MSRTAAGPYRFLARITYNERQPRVDAFGKGSKSTMAVTSARVRRKVVISRSNAFSSTRSIFCSSAADGRAAAEKMTFPLAMKVSTSE
jgi:hypothetical protein